jgi:uncharacterized membrane-anchored protein YitT (DUF2179 family)
MKTKNFILHWNNYFNLKTLIFICLGCFSSLVALKGFMIPNKFIDGGVIGISILLHETTHLNISLLLLVLNAPFLYLGYQKLGKSFAYISILSVCLIAFLLQYVHIPMVTTDKALIAVFGGFFIGLGIGFIIKAGGVIDGLEVVAEYTNKKIGLSTSEWVMIINSIIIICAAVSFGLETGMYSLLTYFTAMKTSDYLVDGIEEYTALTIISKESETIKSVIVDDFNKAISIYRGELGYIPGRTDLIKDCDIIVVIVTRLEILRIKKAVHLCDSNAFLYAQSMREVQGGMIKKLRKH